MKVDFGDFQFLRIEPKVVRYVSGVATALLGSGGSYVAIQLKLDMKNFELSFKDLW